MLMNSDIPEKLRKSTKPFHWDWALKLAAADLIEWHEVQYENLESIIADLRKKLNANEHQELR